MDRLGETGAVGGGPNSMFCPRAQCKLVTPLAIKMIIIFLVIFNVIFSVDYFVFIVFYCSTAL